MPDTSVRRTLSGALTALVLALTLAPQAPAAQRPQLTADQRAADFDRMWAFVRDTYCFFPEKTTDWNAVRERYRPLAVSAADNRAFVAVLESTLDELYDAHTHLGVNLASSYRLPPYDVWAELHGGRAVVVDVRRDSPSARAGLAPGAEIVAVDGKPVAEAVAERRPRCLRTPDPEADEWALLSILSGRHDRDREFTVRDAGGASRTIRVPNEDSGGGDRPAVEWRMLAGGVGYVRIASFGDEAAVAQFDRALEELKATRALVIDVRDNPGGDTEIARPMMGRLIDRRAQYAWMARRDGDRLGARWAEYVDPRGPWTYRRPVAVIVNRWSESMAEGFAMGLDGIGRAAVVGTRMGGLGAGIARTTLEHSGFGVQVSAEPVYHVNGRPRSSFRPRVPVRPAGGPGDPYLDAALRRLGRSRAR